MTKKILLLCLSILILSGLWSCSSDYDDIKITNIQKINLSTLMNAQGNLELSIEIDNPETKTVTIKSIDLKALNQKGNILATVKLLEHVRILKQQKKYYQFPLELNIEDPVAGFIAYNSFRKGNPSIRIEGVMRVRAGWFTHTIKIDQSITKELIQLF